MALCFYVNSVEMHDSWKSCLMCILSYKNPFDVWLCSIFFPAIHSKRMKNNNDSGWERTGVSMQFNVYTLYWLFIHELIWKINNNQILRIQKAVTCTIPYFHSICFFKICFSLDFVAQLARSFFAMLQHASDDLQCQYFTRDHHLHRRMNV